jgi:hypothetical protein
MLTAIAGSRSEQLALEPSIPLAQNVFAVLRVRPSTLVTQAELSPGNSGVTEPLATKRQLKKSTPKWKNGE